MGTRKKSQAKSAAAQQVLGSLPQVEAADQEVASESTATEQRTWDQLVDEEMARQPLSNAFDKAPSKERLHQLEDEFTKKMAVANKTAAEAIEVILMIRDERQYIAGGYETFDAYMADRWDHTRQWVELMEKRLKMMDVMQDKMGFSLDEARKKLTVFDATILRPLLSDPEAMVEAMKESEEQYKAGGKKSPKILREVVHKWEGFKTLKETLNPAEQETSPAEVPQPVTPEEFKLLDQLRRNKSNPRCTGLVVRAKEKAEAESIGLALALDKVCEEEKRVPPNEELLKVARGEDLKELIAPLILRVKIWQAEDKLKETGALKESEQAKAELGNLQKEMAKTPEQKQQERRELKAKERKEEEALEQRRLELEKEREEAAKEQEIWQWQEDELSLSSNEDPRKWAEAKSREGEGYDSNTLARIAADCLADAVKRLPLVDADKRADIMQAARKAYDLADKLVSELGK